MNYWRRLGICLAILIFAIPCHAGGPKRTTYTFLRIDQPIVEQRLRSIPSTGWAKEIQKHVQAAHTKSVCEQEVVPDETEPNLICTVPGTSSSTIVISAPLDSAKPNRWASVSMLPLLLESLAPVANSSTYVFAAFTGHDSNNAGANWYLSHLDSAHRKRVKALIALDALDQNPAVYAGGANSGDLMSWIPNAADALLLPPPSLSPNGIASEAAVFERAEIPTITFSSASGTALPSYYDTYRFLCVYLVAIGRARGPAPPLPSEATPVPKQGRQGTWVLLGPRRGEYIVSIDSNTLHSNSKSVCMKSKVAAPNGSVSLVQQFNAAEYPEKKLRLSMWAKGVVLRNSAMLWMLIDNGQGGTTSLPMGVRFGEWQKYEISMKVPKGATAVTFGMTLSGVGELWISDIQLNLSDQAGKKTEWSEKPGFAPANLDFSLGLFERATG